LELAQPAPASAFGNQGALIRSHRAADLEEELIVRVLAHRAVQELDPTAMLLECFEEENLADIVPGEAVWVGHQDFLELGRRDMVAQSIQTGPVEGVAAVAVVAEEVGLRQVPPLGGEVGAQALDLLINGLGLQPSRDADIDRYLHA
jgi:hypothetical protein